MQSNKYQLQEFHFSNDHLKLWLPDLATVQELHQSTIGSDFPYWAKIWPSSLAMIQFLELNPEMIEGKELLEIGAGIGLPSFYASSKAISVICSDYMFEAVNLMEHNIQFNHMKNMHAMKLDWNQLPISIIPEIVLMCDVNYQPNHFHGLLSCMKKILEMGCTIILSTPQRIVAREFITKILPWAIKNQLFSEGELPDQTFVNILVLKQTTVEF